MTSTVMPLFVWAALLSFAAAAAVAGPPDGALPQATATGPALYAGLHWRQLGPFRGGWATMVDGVANRPDTFFFAAAGGGVWRTDNAGRTWNPLFTRGPAAPVGAIAVAPSDPDTLYIGTGQPEPRYDIAAGLGVFKSTDGGRSWSALGLRGTRYIGKIWVSPTDPNTVLVGAQGHFFGPSPDRGIYRSTDGGKTWSQVLKTGDSTGVVDIASDPQAPQTLFAAAWDARQYPWQSYFTPVAGPGSALYKSTDGGVSWTRLGGGGWPAGDLGRISLAVAHLPAGIRLYAVVDGGADQTRSGLYRSDDGGASWRLVNREKAFTSYYASRITVAPDDPEIVYTVGQSIRRCTDGGARCSIIKGAPGGDDYHHIWINPAHPDHIITGSDQGAVVSVDAGQSWSSWYNQPTGQFYHLAADNRFPYWIYSGQQDSGTVGIASRSDYGALTFRDWHPVGGDERDYDIPDPADPLIVYGSGLGGRVTKWNGHTGQVQNISPWPVSSYGKRPTDTRYHYLWVTPLVEARGALYLGAQNLFRSTDQGKTWTTISNDLTGKASAGNNLPGTAPGGTACGGTPSLNDAKLCGYGAISAIMPSPRHADEIWVGTDDGLIQLTRDSGAHWIDVTPPSIPLWGKISTLDVSALQDGTAYAAVDLQRLDDFTPHILRTHDGGRSWQDIAAGLPRDHFVSVVRADPQRAGLLYAGTDAGVFVSFDDGGHWSALQLDLPTAWVRDLLVHGDDLIAATQGRAIWVLDDIAPLRELAGGIAAGAPHLFTPSPAIRVHPDANADTPLPPETPQGENPPAGAIIDYVLPPSSAGKVTLEIQDQAGHVVRHFESGQAPAKIAAERYFDAGWTRKPQTLPATPGMHRFVWDLRYDRPQAINYSYSIAAVWGKDTPILPLGPYVLPGEYRVILSAGGQTLQAPLTVTLDPRIHTPPADLAQSLDLSRRITAALARARIAYAEQQAVLSQIGPSAAAPAIAPAAGKPADHGAGPQDQARDVGDQLRRKPGPGEVSFDGADEILGAIEADLESADVAPTKAQRAVVDDTTRKLQDATRRWDEFKATTLIALNAARAKAGRPAITLPRPDRLDLTPPDAGQDLP